jgi:hypothetical protein
MPNVADIELSDDNLADYIAEAIRLRKGEPLPVLESISAAVASGPFSRSELYRRGPTGTGEIEFRKLSSRTMIVTMSRLRAAAHLPRVMPLRQSANRAA